MSIYFDGSNVGIQIAPIEYQSNYTVSNMYDYLAQYQLDRQQYSLTLDGQTMLNPQDSSYISQFFQPNAALYVVQAQPTFNVYFEGQQILTNQLPNMAILDLLTYLQQQGVNLGQNVQVDFYDQSSTPLFMNADINEGLYNYTNGNQIVIINITPLQQQEIPKQMGSNTKVDSFKQQNIGANELLQSLILLKNVSLLIDPNGQFVVYKFHFPTLIQGYLQRSQGKDAANITHFSVVHADWIEKNNIKYCSFDDYGFAITWEDGNVSSVKIKQQ
ncbi:unnamed protein product (macronuclear) [Paramecium tetraurelia]|uniref:Ubiquitin-like domain-containing protein n=1 Tax=Paramecium tetraurelia TaxID=5888 RepID=A0DNR7_PARTE|nr:uncharacterized protein GSPATT00018880001 [Paramecium tetraurelia]CAK84684.1 unnamed protein product [Paramecium tetraurelia]|eukprot:XP_001452081.1 hypothetical protein (macronuclear) [Paramecium tetraurelia strain d4-2]